MGRVAAMSPFRALGALLVLALSVTPGLANGPGGLLRGLLSADRPVVVAHGKNLNVAEESTWDNLAHSVRSGAEVLEVDVQALAPTETATGPRCDFLVFHDPTPHRLVRGYETPSAKIEAFEKTHPDLANGHRWSWDYLLFDRISTFTADQAKEALWIRDEGSGLSYEPILLDELLAAIATPGRFEVPPFGVRSPDGAVSRRPSLSLSSGRPLFLYLDLKDLNPAARRLAGLPSWDWHRGSWPTERLLDHARAVLASLSDLLLRTETHDRVFIAVRHEALAALAREVDPRIALMASTELATGDTPIEDFLGLLRAFEAQRPEFVEVKHLAHVVCPEIHREARARHWQVFHNAIVQTDATQFEGVFQGNLPHLVHEILGPSEDVFIQTNTVADLVSVLAGGR